MERGLFWLPLLAVFVWLAWAGWNEFQKVEVYRGWAAQFERAKYDIYAVLGQRGDELTWGTPTRRGMLNLKTLSLREVTAVHLRVNDQPADLTQPPTQGKAVLELRRSSGLATVEIPFTEPAMAAAWGQRLQQDLSPDSQAAGPTAG